MTPLEWACLARDAYTVSPHLGPENSAGRIVFNPTADGLVLSIPGTNNAACVLADSDAWPLETNGCGRVHAGIWRAFDSVWMDVAGLDVHALVGHSEGAAGAIYLAARLCRAGKPPAIVWAFEPPRTAVDAILAGILAAHDVDLHITQHGLDLVPDMPPGLIDPWQHAGPVWRFGIAALPIPNIIDHSISAIVDTLRGAS